MAALSPPMFICSTDTLQCGHISLFLPGPLGGPLCGSGLCADVFVMWCVFHVV